MVRDGEKGPVATQMVKRRVQTRMERKRTGPQEWLVITRRPVTDDRTLESRASRDTTDHDACYRYQQLLLNSRRNGLPVKCIDGSFLMRHEHAPGVLVELMQIGKTPSGADPLLQHAPEAFHGIEVVSAAGWQELQPKRLLPVGECRGELVGAVDATAVDHHDHLFPGGAKAGHDLMDILPKPFRIKLGDHFIKDVRRPILDGADDTEQHAAGHTAPTPIAPPRLALEHFFTLDLACTQWSGR